MTATDPPTPPEGDPPKDPPAPDPKNPPAPGEPDEHTRTLLDELKTERKARKRLEEELEKSKREGMSDAERKIAEAREEGKSEALRESNERLLRAEVRAIAADKLSDPSDAVRLLDLSEFTPGEDGSFDAKQITGAIDALVEAKPYLAKQPANGHAPKVPQGTRGTPGAAAGEPGQSDGDAFLRGLLKQQ